MDFVYSSSWGLGSRDHCDKKSDVYVLLFRALPNIIKFLSIFIACYWAFVQGCSASNVFMGNSCVYASFVCVEKVDRITQGSVKDYLSFQDSSYPRFNFICRIINNNKSKNNYRIDLLVKCDNIIKCLFLHDSIFGIKQKKIEQQRYCCKLMMDNKSSGKKLKPKQSQLLEAHRLSGKHSKSIESISKLHQYNQRHPTQNITIKPKTNILSAILIYFSQQNVKVLMSGIDIFSQEYSQTNGEGQKQLNEEQILNSQISHKSIEYQFDKWIKEKVNKGKENENQEMKIVWFLEYLFKALEEELTLEINEEKQIQQKEESQQKEEVEVEGENQFQIQNPVEIPEYAFSEQQKKYLSEYYRHFCELKSYLPQGKTFDDIKLLNSTMMLPQWMMFCKKAHLILKNTDFSHNSRHHRTQNQLTIKELTLIFQNNQGNNKKLSYEQFCAAVSDIIKIIFRNNQSGNFPSLAINPIQFLGLIDDPNHFQVMDQLGIRYIKQKVYFYNLSPSNLSQNMKMDQSVSKSVLLETPKLATSKEKTKKSYSKIKIIQKQNKVKLHDKTASKTMPKPTTKSVDSHHPIQQNQLNKTQAKKIKKQIKFYRSRQERKQSELLKKLNISNLNLLKPPNDVLCNISQLSSLEDDDFYLREYNRKQKEVSEGVVRRLNKNIKKMQKRMR